MYCVNKFPPVELRVLICIPVLNDLTVAVGNNNPFTFVGVLTLLPAVELPPNCVVMPDIFITLPTAKVFPTASPPATVTLPPCVKELASVVLATDNPPGTIKQPVVEFTDVCVFPILIVPFMSSVYIGFVVPIPTNTLPELP